MIPIKGEITKERLINIATEILDKKGYLNYDVNNIKLIYCQTYGTIEFDDINEFLDVIKNQRGDSFCFVTYKMVNKYMEIFNIGFKNDNFYYCLEEFGDVWINGWSMYSISKDEFNKITTLDSIINKL